jgi:hypothetical protein
MPKSNIVVLRPAEAGALGGKKRAEQLSAEERRTIAVTAARARWSSDTAPDVPRATHSGVLKIGDAEIPCYVLENGERILSTRGIMKSLGRSWRGRKYAGTQAPVFLEANNLKPYLPKDLGPVLVARNFKTDKGAGGEGFKAEILPVVCETYLTARDADVLTASQIEIAKTCALLVRGLSRVGVIALVDEATGYQEDRARDELHKILEAYIASELLPWTKRFPDEFFKEMFRVWGWSWPPTTNGYRGPLGPRYAGKLVRQLIYENLPPGVLQRLDEISPPDDKWQRRNRFPRALTKDIGQSHLDKLVAQMTLLFRLSDDPDGFWRQYHRAFPRSGDQMELLPS